MILAGFPSPPSANLHVGGLMSHYYALFVTLGVIVAAVIAERRWKACGGTPGPVGQTVRLELTSPDVIHGFWVPAFLFKMDAIRGKPNAFELTPHHRGHLRRQVRRALRRLSLPDALQRQGRQPRGVPRPPYYYVT